MLLNWFRGVIRGQEKGSNPTAENIYQKNANREKALDVFDQKNLRFPRGSKAIVQFTQELTMISKVISYRLVALS